MDLLPHTPRLAAGLYTWGFQRGVCVNSPLVAVIITCLDRKNYYSTDNKNLNNTPPAYSGNFYLANSLLKIKRNTKHTTTR